MYKLLLPLLVLNIASSTTANAVTLEQFNALTSEQQNTIYRHILNDTIYNNLEGEDLITCASNFFHVAVEGWDGASQGTVDFARMTMDLSEANRLDLQIQDIIYTIIQNNCMQSE